MNTSTSPAVTVVMRCKNSDWVIGQALAALFSQTYRDFELLVVDSGSRDNSLELVNAYPRRLIRVEPREYVPGVVLNRAVEECRSEIIVFQNSDTVPLHAECLERLVGAVRDGAAAAFARQIPRPEAVAWVRRDYAASFPAAGPAPPWMPLSLPFAAMRRSVWKQHPFYTSAWASEDTEWGHWALRHQHRVVYRPDALVMHSHNYTLREIHGRRFVEGEADAFIQGGPVSWGATCQRAARSIVGDWLWQLPRGEWLEAARSIPRRWVYHAAYQRGRAWGARRLARGDGDTGRGQQVVLASQPAAAQRRAAAELQDAEGPNAAAARRPS